MISKRLAVYASRPDCTQSRSCCPMDRRREAKQTGRLQEYRAAGRYLPGRRLLQSGLPLQMSSRTPCGGALRVREAGMADFASVQLRAAVRTASASVWTRTAHMLSAEAQRRAGRVSPCAHCCGAPGGPLAYPGGVAQVCANPAPRANQRNQKQVSTLLRGIPEGAMDEPHGAVQGCRWRQAAVRF